MVLGRVIINRRRCPLCSDTDRLCATAANVAMGHKRQAARKRLTSGRFRYTGGSRRQDANGTAVRIQMAQPSCAGLERRELIGIVAAAEIADGLGVGWGASRSQLRQFLEIVLMAGRRDSHDYACGLVGFVGDVVRYSRRDEWRGQFPRRS